MHCSSVVSPKQDYVIAKEDSVASSHYWQEADKNILIEVTSFNSPSVLLPNNNTVKSTSKGEIPLSDKLSKAAKTVKIRIW